ncbi:hypothetical protein [Hahella ganghwensis]|uniref:hypothetical protein n=1 Tax=Hahella ganghwensis TaxID=286420 RepID=UPI000366E99E|nr:hypothetical protein [Hahella ganghwensis]
MTDSVHNLQKIRQAVKQIEILFLSASPSEQAAKEYEHYRNEILRACATISTSLTVEHQPAE